MKNIFTAPTRPYGKGGAFSHKIDYVTISVTVYLGLVFIKGSPKTKSRTRETPNLSTDADSSINIFFRRR